MTLPRFIMAFLLLLVIHSVRGQSIDQIRITKEFNNEPLIQIFKDLKKSYKIKIAYDVELISGVNVSLAIVDEPLPQVLNQLLVNTAIDYLIINNKVVIIPRTEQKSQYDALIKNSIPIKGVIRDESSGETLPNATIRIGKSNKGTVSNIDGFFSLLSVPSDTTTLTISYLGYMQKQIKLSPEMDNSNLVIDLQNDVKLLEDITVYDSYDKSIEVTDEVSKISFNPRSMTSLPSLGELDLFKTIQLMPGVSGENESSANLIIRGSLPSQNLVLLDGFTIYHLDHFFGLFSALNPDVVKDVQVFKGGFESKYGGRVGGVVDIVGKSGNTNKPTLNLGLNLISMRGTFESPIGKKFNMLISVRRAFTDIIQSGLYNKLFKIARRNDEQITRPLDDPKLDEITPDFFFTDFNSKFSYRPSKKDIIALSLYSGADNLSGNTTTKIEDNTVPAFFEETLNEVTEWGNNGISLKWGRQWNNIHYSNLRLSIGSFFKDYNFNYTSELNVPDSITVFDADFRQTNDINDVNLSFDNEVSINDRVKLEAGISLAGHEISYRTFVGEALANEDANEGSISSLYATINADLTPKLAASVGARLNYHNTNEESYNEPRLGLKYEVNESLKLKAAVGKYHQFVNQIVYDDPYQGNQNFWVFSNFEGAPVVESNHYIAGFTYQIGSLLLDVEGYVKDLNGLVEFNLVPFYISDDLDDVGFLFDGNGRMRGIDFLVQKEIRNYKGWVAYSWSKSEQAFDQINDGTYYPSLQDRRHEFKFVNMYNLGKWRFSASWIFGSGRPFAEFDVGFLADDTGIITDFAVVKTNTNLQRLPDYHRLDLSASYDLKLGNNKGQVGVSVFNAYGRKNIKSRKPNIAKLQSAIGSSAIAPPELTYRDLVLIGFTPSVFINFQF